MITYRTPPHLMKYAKLILILIKQLVDMNFDKSYSARRSVMKNCSTNENIIWRTDNSMSRMIE